MDNRCLINVMWTVGMVSGLWFTVADSSLARTPLPTPDQESEIRFAAIDVWIDSGSRPLGAYQFELQEGAGRIAIVGVEGGEHEAFAEPPYYDARALRQDRIIIADFSMADDLPRGRTRVARVHVQITGPADIDCTVALKVSADDRGRDIQADTDIEITE